MNTIVTFRLCISPDDELLKKVDEMTDNMYETQKVPTRQIPARPDHDYDLLVGELHKRCYERITTISLNNINL